MYLCICTCPQASFKKELCLKDKASKRNAGRGSYDAKHTLALFGSRLRRQTSPMQRRHIMRWQCRKHYCEFTLSLGQGLQLPHDAFYITARSCCLQAQQCPLPAAELISAYKELLHSSHR